MSGPHSRIIEAVVKIAENLGGNLPLMSSGNRLADNLEYIAENMDSPSSGGGSDMFYIYAIGDADEGVITGLSKTYQEIYEAVFDQEKLPVFVDLDGHHYQYDRFNAGFEFLNVSFGFDSPDKINSIIARWFSIKSDGTYETKYGYRSFS